MFKRTNSTETVPIQTPRPMGPKCPIRTPLPPPPSGPIQTPRPAGPVAKQRRQELVAGVHGVEARYPFLDRMVVQEPLALHEKKKRLPRFGGEFLKL